MEQERFYSHTQLSILRCGFYINFPLIVAIVFLELGSNTKTLAVGMIYSRIAGRGAGIGRQASFRN